MYHLQNARGQLFHFFRVKSFFPTLEYIKLYAAMPNKTILFIKILLDVFTLTNACSTKIKNIQGCVLEKEQCYKFEYTRCSSYFKTI